MIEHKNSGARGNVLTTFHPLAMIGSSSSLDLFKGIIQEWVTLHQMGYLH